MQYKNILITGGAGFVGSNLGINLKKNYQNIHIYALDNLKRRGSELNIARLKKYGIEFIHGDIRNKEDLILKNIDLILECSAEPSVMAGVTSSPEYVINTNLTGTLNCLELARIHQADFIFLSTSRVYPIKPTNNLNFEETNTRFELTKDQSILGSSINGIAEDFLLTGARSIYGATKLASELMVQEYLTNYNIKGVINRCGVITGPWQMGKVDQGVIVLWLAKHIFKQKLSYIGYGGEGKQVRDFIHVDDLFDIINIQLNDLNSFNEEIYNIGGGRKISTSLQELTKICQELTGNTIPIDSVTENRTGDIRIYLSNCKKIQEKTNWQPKKNVEETLTDIYKWIIDNQKQLVSIL